MPKQTVTLAPDIRPDRRRSRMLPIASLFVTVPLLAPVFIDAVALCYAQWSELLGTPVAVRTPTLDAIDERLTEIRQDLWMRVSSRFHRVPWNPYVVLAVAVVLMSLGSLMLRL